jgi:hypothetical protein
MEKPPPVVALRFIAPHLVWQSSGQESSFVVTLKALPNFSQGFALKPWVTSAHLFRRNSEGVAKGL